jgi:hypothetical protein
MMIPLLKKLWDSLLHDEMKVRRWLRVAVMAIGGSGLGYADQIAATINTPGAIKTIKVLAVVCMGISVMINLGDKNPPKEGNNATPPAA